MWRTRGRPGPNSRCRLMVSAQVWRMLRGAAAQGRTSGRGSARGVGQGGSDRDKRRLRHVRGTEGAEDEAVDRAAAKHEAVGGTAEGEVAELVALAEVLSGAKVRVQHTGRHVAH